MRTMPRIALAAVLLVPAAASGATNDSFDFQVNSGSLTSGGETYSQFIFGPSLRRGLFEARLAVNYDFTARFRPREGEWQTWQAVVSKIVHCAYGGEQGPLHVVLGAFQRMTLGHGSIMYEFNPGALEPDLRMLGLRAAWKSPLVECEYYMDSVIDRDIHAARVVAAPAKDTNAGWLGTIKLGATVAADLDNRNTYKSGTEKYSFTDNHASEGVTVFGLDVEFGLPKLLFVEANMYIDWVRIAGKGAGLDIGLAGTAWGTVYWRYELKTADPRHTEPYFDAYYLKERAAKYDYLGTLKYRYLGMDFSVWQTVRDGDTELLSYKVRYRANTRERASLDLSLALGRKVLFNVAEASLTCSRKGFYGAYDFFDFREARTSTQLESTIRLFFGQSNALEVQYKKTYTPDPVTGVLAGDEVTSIQLTSKM